MKKKLISYKDMFALQLECNVFLIENDFLVLEKKKKADKESKDEVQVEQKPSYKWNEDKASTKLSLGIKSILKQIDKFIPDYNEQKQNIFEGNALTEKSGKIIYEGTGKEKTIAYSPEGLKRIREQVKDLDQETVTLYTRIQEETKVDLFQYPSFNGVLVPETTNDWDLTEDELEDSKQPKASE
jgi:hypothetical protein